MRLTDVFSFASSALLLLVACDDTATRRETASIVVKGQARDPLVNALNPGEMCPLYSQADGGKPTCPVGCHWEANLHAKSGPRRSPEPEQQLCIKD